MDRAESFAREYRDSFLAGMNPMEIEHEYRAGLLFASRIGAELGNVLSDRGYPAESVALLWIFADIVRHLGSGTNS